MNGIPMRFDYTKTINEQLPTFEYYRNRYISYELQIMELQQENKKLREKYKATNKGLKKVLSKRLKWKRRYYKEKYIRKELKKWLEEQTDYLTEIDGQSIPLKDNFEFCSMNELYQTGKYSGFKDALDKIKELEEGVKE